MKIFRINRLILFFFAVILLIGSIYYVRQQSIKEPPEKADLVFDNILKD